MDKQLENEIISLFSRLMKPRDDRLNNLSRLGKVLMMKAGNTQSAQVQTANNEIADNVKFIEAYGFTAKPKQNSECILLNIQGNPGNVVALVIGNRELRFKKLNDGEVAMYDDSGNLLHFKNGGIIDFKAPENMNQTAQTINISGTTAVNVNTQTSAVTAKTLNVEADTAAIKAKTATVDAQTTTVNGKVNLAGGGQPVARLGDTVEVDPNTHKGTITAGSTEVTAG